MGVDSAPRIIDVGLLSAAIDDDADDDSKCHYRANNNSNDGPRAESTTTVAPVFLSLFTLICTVQYIQS